MHDRIAHGDSERGVALVAVLVLGVLLMSMTVVSLNMSQAHVQANRTQRTAFQATQIAVSGAAQALARINHGGVLAAASGGGVLPVWVQFAEGDYWYETDYDLLSATTTVRAWGRVSADSITASNSVAPDDGSWDPTGWLVRGLEISIKSTSYIPEAPAYFGNGGFERPLGGFEWTGGTDPADPSTWTPVTSSPDSYQSGGNFFTLNALDHPGDYLYNGGMPAPAGDPHPYNLFVNQNTVGQTNTEAWFANSAPGYDPLDLVLPDSTVFNPDPTSPDAQFAVDPYIPDVQDFSWALWSKFKDDLTVNKLNGGSLSGTYGDYVNPNVTFVTGGLTVPSGTTFEGAGVLVIRDAYDPNVDTNNTPSTRALLNISGEFKWTGLVVIAGWAPSIVVNGGGDATIVGTVMGEDSVQSGSEVSLDSATIVVRLSDDFRVLYSNSLFTTGGLINQLLPEVNREVVGVRSL